MLAARGKTPALRLVLPWMVGLFLPLLNRKSCTFTTNAYSRDLKMERLPCSGSPLSLLAGNGFYSPAQAVSSHTRIVMAMTAGQHMTRTSPQEAEADLVPDGPGPGPVLGSYRLSRCLQLCSEAHRTDGALPIATNSCSSALGWRPQHPHSVSSSRLHGVTTESARVDSAYNCTPFHIRPL